MIIRIKSAILLSEIGVRKMAKLMQMVKDKYRIAIFSPKEEEYAVKY